MSVEIQLLGRPTARADGGPIALRGVKPWVVLALLVLHAAPVSRDRLARMLFADAIDPAAALRWNLSQLRRCLDLELTGDPVRLAESPDVTIDLEVLLRGTADDGATLPGLDEELLAGVHVDGAPELDLWLEDERRHLRQVGIAVREEAALAALGRGNTEQALLLARQVAEAAPLNETAAALFVRCLRAAGRLSEARTAAEHTATRLRDELGVEPTAQLWSAVASPPGGDRRVTGASAVLAQLDAGTSAVAAGAADVGVAALRSAVVGARAINDTHLLARSLVALGSALIHGVRGTDQEGLALLHEAVALTATDRDAELATTSRREIGYVDLLRGRYDRALHWLDQAREHAEESEGIELAWIDTYVGTCLDDVGDREAAAAVFDRALRSARTSHGARLEAYTLAVVGRQHLMLGRHEDAHAALETSLEIVDEIGWTSLRPWPQALLADLLRQEGQLPRARRLSEQALVLAEQVGDPCWEAAALRSLGMVTVDSGNIDDGVEMLRAVPGVCRRLPDTYRWVEVWGYNALVEVARRHRLPQAHSWAQHLTEAASSHGMHPLAEHAHRTLTAGHGQPSRPTERRNL